MLQTKVNKRCICVWIQSTELMKNGIREGPSLTYEKAKGIAKLEEGANQLIKSITHNSNKQKRSIDNVQRFRKPKFQPAGSVKEVFTTALDLSLQTKTLEATIAIKSNKQVITIVSKRFAKSNCGHHHNTGQWQLQITICQKCSDTAHLKDFHSTNPRYQSKNHKRFGHFRQECVKHQEESVMSMLTAFIMKKKSCFLKILFVVTFMLLLLLHQCHQSTDNT